MARRSGLGKGLGALIPTEARDRDSALRVVPMTSIKPNPLQPRTRFDEEAMSSLAASIRAQEEKMLERVLREIPSLTDAVVSADVQGNRSYDVADTGAAEVIRQAGANLKESAGAVELRARRTARSARKVPGVARAEGQVKGIVASAKDLAIPNYDKLTASEIVERLPELSQVELAKVEAYERRHQKRTTILSRISALKAEEPWPGYDELNVNEIREALSAGEEELARGPGELVVMRVVVAVKGDFLVGAVLAVFGDCGLEELPAEASLAQVAGGIGGIAPFELGR